MATIRWPRNCEYARVTTETKTRVGHQKLARAIGLIAEPEARRLAGEVMADLFEIAGLMAEVKYGNEGTFERAHTTPAGIATVDGR